MAKKNIQREEFAYLAGFFDGEGCITIRNCKHQKELKSYNSLACNVTSTNSWILEWFHFSFGGSISQRRYTYEYYNKKISCCPQWQICSNEAVRFLETLLPFLKLKKPEAELAIRFQETKRERGKGGHLSEGERAVEETQRLLMKQLKKEVKNGKTDYKEKGQQKARND